MLKNVKSADKVSKKHLNPWTLFSNSIGEELNLLCFLLTYKVVYYHNKNGWFR